jgi:hypothetical protein
MLETVRRFGATDRRADGDRMMLAPLQSHQ